MVPLPLMTLTLCLHFLLEALPPIRSNSVVETSWPAGELTIRHRSCTQLSIGFCQHWLLSTLCDMPTDGQVEVEGSPWQLTRPVVSDKVPTASPQQIFTASPLLIMP